MRHDTPAKLRRALADLLADVVDGTVKNGGNPRSLDSVKAAALALTGDKFGFCGSEHKTSRKAEPFTLSNVGTVSRPARRSGEPRKGE